MLYQMRTLEYRLARYVQGDAYEKHVRVELRRIARQHGGEQLPCEGRIPASISFFEISPGWTGVSHSFFEELIA